MRRLPIAKARCTCVASCARNGCSRSSWGIFERTSCGDWQSTNKSLSPLGLWSHGFLPRGSRPGLYSCAASRLNLLTTEETEVHRGTPQRKVKTPVPATLNDAVDASFSGFISIGLFHFVHFSGLFQPLLHRRQLWERGVRFGLIPVGDRVEVVTAIIRGSVLDGRAQRFLKSDRRIQVEAVERPLRSLLLRTDNRCPE